jgi:class 3 adenylate cyclase/tetratricopeptide (TPR) repeat protein
VQCPQCQHENREAAKFCEDCGERLLRACAQCGSELTPSARFCSECGTAAATVTVAGVPILSPEAYTPQHLAERILTSRAALEGERKQVTVLFADLKGSMELLADRDPEEARAILDPVLERMMEAVHRYEGTVNQVMGDGIMALFGAPLAHEDHAVRACYAALQMQESVKQYADAVWRSQSVRIQIRVGLNSGEVVVGSIGSDLRMEYTAVGQTTHLAARMEQLATPGTVLIAPDTLQLVEGYVQVQALGPVQVKGLTEPVEVYELTGAGPARSRLQAAAARGLTKFVGREAELETLRRTLEQAGSGQGQIVALVGEPGVGKSRLIWEFSHSYRTQGWLVLASGSVSYGKATSYLPVIDLLKSYCGIESQDDHRHLREKVLGKLLALDRALEPTLPALVGLLDVPVNDPAWTMLDPSQRRQRTLDAVKRLILRESQEQPFLLVFEDLHWIDTETQALLDSLAESLPTARLLLLVNYRPEYEHAWHGKTYYRELRLDPLPPESAEVLLQTLLGGDAGLAPLKELLIERTEGNPFFLEESVRTLVESGALAGEQGAYRLAKVGSPQVPATVQAVLAARIDRLSPDDKRLLQAAAVVGKDLPYPILQAIAELPEDELRRSLARLQAAEFLYETSLFPDLEYTFKHALTHEVAYGSLLHERRRALHARIVAGIEALYPDRLAEHVDRLAYHASRGELWEKAGLYSRQTGEKAAARSAYPEAVAYYDQAQVAIEHLPNTRDALEQAIDVRLDRQGSLQALGQHTRLLDDLRAAEKLATALDDPRRLGWVSCFTASCLRRANKYDEAVPCAERALSIGIAEGDSMMQIGGRIYLAMALHDMGDYDQAATVLRQSLAALRDDLGHERFGLHFMPAVNPRVWLTRCLIARGEFAEAAALADEALRIAEAADHPFSLVSALQAVGARHLLQGDLQQAIPSLERGLSLAEDWHLLLLIPVVTSALGCAYALSGRLDEALALLEHRMQLCPAAHRVNLLTEVHLLAGRLADAAEAARQALDLSREYRERGEEASTLRLLGAIAAHAEPPEVEQAVSCYGQALALAEELGMRPLAAHCHLSLGTLYAKIGRDDQAQAELASAAEMYRAMEMAFWLARAETALGQIASVPERP